MKAWRKVILLLMINIALTAFALYFFHYMRIINYKQILSTISGQENAATPMRIDDPFLLEKEELLKKWEALNIKTLELSNQIIVLASNNQQIENDKQTLLSERDAFLNEQALVALKKEEQNTYEIKITDVATQIVGMPPDAAAELLNLQDDIQVADIFKKMEELAAANGQASTVPFLLTLLDREKAARIQTIMLVEE